AASFHAQGTPGVTLWVLRDARSVKLPSSVGRWALGPGPELLLAMDAPSKDVGDEKVGEGSRWIPGSCGVLGEGLGFPLDPGILLGVEIPAGSRDPAGRCDSHWMPRFLVIPGFQLGFLQDPGILLGVGIRTGTWDPAGTPNFPTSPLSFPISPQFSPFSLFPADLQDMSQLVLRTRGPRAIFAGHRLLLHVDFAHADKIRVFYGGSGAELEKFRPVLGGSRLSHSVRPGRHCHESRFYVEGLAFPDVAFDGLVSLHVTLLESHEKVRVGQRGQSPNSSPNSIPAIPQPPFSHFSLNFPILPPARIPILPLFPQFSHPTTSQNSNSPTFPSIFLPQGKLGQGGWIPKSHPQSCIFFKPFSPRFSPTQGPDFGYVARQAPDGASSLDSFGNLEVSPPVTVRGKEYPLGRILIGTSFPRVGGRRVAKAVRDFLVAQKVQAPVELFADWLHVGHVDEFLSFVPAPDRKGFRLLLASPSACYQLLREKQEEGFGEAAMFQGLDRVPKPTINEILANEELRKFNDYAQ
ncbi:PADI1 deiminase, partial [Sylvietta virens]|nr:PADI1 deiminase [Sylvietta virens]